MILHERCDIIELVEDDFYGDITPTLRKANVPCEMSPLSTATKAGRGVTLTADYLWICQDTTIPTEASPGSWVVRWRGRDWKVQGVVEDHYAGGRLRHREAVVRTTS